jgi:hypothetical protein
MLHTIQIRKLRENYRRKPEALRSGLEQRTRGRYSTRR